ncbi:Inactive rhomboid protein 1 [Sergentomyia squamirostris]
MSSDDGSDYHKHSQSHKSVSSSASASISSATAHQEGLIVSHNGGMCVSVGCNTTINRRKGSATSHGGSHFQLAPPGHSLKEREPTEATYSNIVSPSRYIPPDQYQLTARLAATAPPPERFSDDIVTCCLPPPSPAPNSDRFVMGLPSPSPSASGYAEHGGTRYSVHHRTLSPNSRYRASYSDRFRDVSPKCDRFVPPPTAHYLANSTPLASADNYSYLTSTVHTPVKRYVPTPPPPTTDVYSDSSVSGVSSASSGALCPVAYSLPPSGQQPPNGGGSGTLRNNVPYRLRLKCCLNEHQMAAVGGAGVADHYATPPRVRPLKCPAVPPCSITPTPRTGHEFMPRTPSVEYMGPNGGRVVTPVSVMSEPGSGSATCTHCNTMRRTTGVHQTTQTTGPISPVPPSLPLSSAESSHSELSAAGDSTSPPSPPSTASLASMSLLPQQSSSGAQTAVQTPTTSAPQAPISPVPSILSQQQQSQPPVSHSSADDLSSPASSHKQPPQAMQPPERTSNPALLNNRNLVLHHGSTLTLQRGTLRHPHMQQMRISRKQRVKNYIRHELAKFFGVDTVDEEHERIKWSERQKRLALRRFGPLNENAEGGGFAPGERREQHGDRPDILPAQTSEEMSVRHLNADRRSLGEAIERKASVAKMAWQGITYIVHALSKKNPRSTFQWSRSFAPLHCTSQEDLNSDMCEGLSPLQEDEVFFDTPSTPGAPPAGGGTVASAAAGARQQQGQQMMDNARPMYMGERVHGWRTKSAESQLMGQRNRGQRISSQCLDGVVDNSRRPLPHALKLLRPHELDDRHDYRPFFTYWINTVQILVLIISLICYGVGPIGIGMEQKSGQVLVTSLSLQQVQHQEQRNVWIGLRNDDLVHLGAKFAACMRRDTRILDVIAKTRRQERETACCIRNDDSGCVQSSQADCSIRGLWPTKSISTWKKWSPGDSGPGGRISGSVCGLDPKYCDAPASIAPYEWPDDITKWPICRKTNAFSQRFRFKDHTAEHMVCEVIGHPCCTGVYGECRITTREYCDFVNGYFHEEASLCSQVSCLNDVCGMFPFMSPNFPDQFYRLFTSLCLHAGVLHLIITVAFQHVFLADLERLLGPIRTAVLYICSGIAGNLTSAIFVPYKPEVGPLASLAGTISSLSVLLMLIHWKQLKKPHLALVKLLIIIGTLFAIGTLPWQQNFAGLIAGIISGIALTVALVPFVSLTKYGRKSKINLVWSVMLFYLAMYVAMFVIFYLFPSTFTNLGFGDVINGGTSFGGINNIYGSGGGGPATPPNSGTSGTGGSNGGSVSSSGVSKQMLVGHA